MDKVSRTPLSSQSAGHERLAGMLPEQYSKHVRKCVNLFSNFGIVRKGKLLQDDVALVTFRLNTFCSTMVWIKDAG